MKKIFLSVLALATIYIACDEDDKQTPEKGEEMDKEETKKDETEKEFFLVANRGASTFSVYNTDDRMSVKTVTLKDEGAQPTYFAHSNKYKTIYVGDFANEKVLLYDDSTFEEKGEITIQKGAFHMWLNEAAEQLWVNNIVSKTTSVINLKTNEVIKTIGLPTDMQITGIGSEAVQHDVVLSTDGSKAFVTILDGESKSYIAMYDTETLLFEKSVEIGGDGHLLPVGDKIYAPAQNGNSVTVFGDDDLMEIDDVMFSSAHGIIASDDFVFVTGIADKKIGVINPSENNKVIADIDTDFNTPHNLAVSSDGKTLMVSHSGGMATKVVFYSVAEDGKLSKLSEADSGTNPFGVLRY